MISLVLLPYETQYIRATRNKKNKLKIVKTSNDFNPILEAFRTNNYEFLYETLKEIVDFTKNKSEEYYFVIPDTEFNDINTATYSEYKFENEENDLDFLKQNGVDIKNNYYCFPTQMKTNDEWLKTYYTISKKNIDTLLEVSKELKMIIKSIEPLSVSLFRYLNKWDKETYILEINNKKSDLIFFSPIFGFYKYQLNIDFASSFYYAHNDITENINTNLEFIDNYFAKKLKGFMNADNNIIIIASEREKQLIQYTAPTNKSYIKTLSTNHADLIINNNNYFAYGIGSLLQILNEGFDLFFYKTLDCLFVKDSNILPKDFVSDISLIQEKYNIQTKSRLLGSILLGFIILQIGAILHFSSIDIPEKLQDDYSLANKEIKTLEQQEKIINQTSSLKEKPLEILSMLLREKPSNSNLGFTKLDLISPTEKSKNNDWIKLGLISNDSLIIKEYVTKLTDNKNFGTINVTSIDNNAQGAKVAEISILKPGQELKSKSNVNKDNKEDKKDENR